jgi:hypothetical protein
MSSRLFQEIRESAVLAIPSTPSLRVIRDAGLFGLPAPDALRPSARWPELLLGSSVASHRRCDPDDEMRRAVGQLSGASALALED